VTYSIVARDPVSGELGAAVQSHWFAAGELVPWAEPGVGAVATQAIVNVAFGPHGLDLMREGIRAPDAIETVVAEDDGEMHRQVAMVDAHGNVAAHTGDRCIREAGHRTGDGFSVQANMMLRDTVWDVMARTFQGSSGPLTYRLLDALDAAEDEGGDVRGRQAAGVLVVKPARSERPWEDVVVHVRVDDHPAPLEELRRLVDLKFAYDRLDLAEKLELAGDLEGALGERRAALASHPDNAEFAFWTALSLASQARLEEARGLLAIALRAHPGWEDLLRRLAADGFVAVSGADLAALLPPAGD
jgi:uncharacterized Ntn-hydrolase superfamily protein